MSQTVVNKDTSRQGKNLCLILHPAKGRRKDKTVVVALKFGASFIHYAVFIFLTKTLVGDKLLPIHTILLFVPPIRKWKCKNTVKNYAAR